MAEPTLMRQHDVCRRRGHHGCPPGVHFHRCAAVTIVNLAREPDRARSLPSRAAQEATVATFLTGPGASAALVIEGEAGIGKSTLWGDGVALALRNGYTVLSVRPAQSEARMSFASLGDLLDPVADTLLPSLPAPQCAVLEVTGCTT